MTHTTPISRRCHRCPLGIGLVLACVLLWCVPAFGHPQDGPHADVEIEIGDDAVVFDTVINLVMIDEMTPVPRENPGDIHPLEEDAIRVALHAYIAREHRVAIDGVEVTPIVDRFVVIRPGPELIPLFPRTGMRGLTRVHLVLRYPIKGAPKRVAMRWGAYPPDYALEPGPDGERPPVQLEARLRAEGLLKIITFTRDEPEFVWHATGLSAADRFARVPDLGQREPRVEAVTIPLASIAILGVQGLVLVVALVRWRMRDPQRRFPRSALLVPLGVLAAAMLWDVGRVRVGARETTPRQLTSGEALAIFRPLHANIYRAFDYQQEGEIYDALARSVTGDLLDALYNQVYRSLIMQDEGGAVSSVQDVRLREASVESIGSADGRDAFNVLARWQVDGVVNHFGHSHWRTNEYLARFSISEGDAGWRISAHEVLEQQRLDTDPFTNPAGTPGRPEGEL